MILGATEIRPIFGLTLVGMAEWIAIAITGSIIVTGGFSLWSILQSRAHVSKQLEAQNKINSARLLLELREQLKHDFGDITYKLYYGHLSKHDDAKLERYLDHLDMMAVYLEDGLLQKTHVSKMHRELFLRVKEDEYTQEFMKDLGAGLYKPLKKLCESL